SVLVLSSLLRFHHPRRTSSSRMRPHTKSAPPPLTTLPSGSPLTARMMFVVTSSSDWHPNACVAPAPGPLRGLPQSTAALVLPDSTPPVAPSPPWALYVVPTLASLRKRFSPWFSLTPQSFPFAHFWETRSRHVLASSMLSWPRVPPFWTSRLR